MQTINFISWKDIRLNGGFWKKWQETAADKTSGAIYNQFNATGRIKAMKLEWKEGMPDKPHVFWDSDIAKWMEGSAYLLYLKEDKELRDNIEKIIDYIEKGQTEEGYFNSAFLTLQPDKCFTDRTNHELYTAGHFIEAAAAHYYATGSTRFLNIMKKFADYIEQRFKINQDTPYKTPGHQELELALVRLWEVTGERRYLELSNYFVMTRGTDAAERVFSVPNGTFPADPPMANQLWYNDTYAQDEAPASELRTAGGHAVRAMYFYTAMADISREYKDKALGEACSRLWMDCVTKKMYVTGGVSAERFGEAIGTDYVLPNDYAYAETCASVAMSNLSQRMFRLEPDSKYMDMIERQMYNGALSGLSLDGEGFFYDNALQCRPKVNDFFTGIHALPLLPPYRRQKVFECSCCPPNIYRFIAAMGQYFYSVDQGKVYVHQFGESQADLEVNGQRLSIRQETDYPWNGNIKLIIETETELEMTAAVRIPGWCPEGFTIKVNGKTNQPIVEKGYAFFPRIWQSGDTIELLFPMKPVKIEGNPNIVEAGGKVAIMCGPIVYCLEGVDNGFSVFDLTLGKIPEILRCEKKMILDFPLMVICGEGQVQEDARWKGKLYQPYAPVYRNVKFTAIPYFAWANRDVCDMTVWIKHA